MQQNTIKLFFNNRLSPKQNLVQFLKLGDIEVEIVSKRVSQELDLMYHNVTYENNFMAQALSGLTNHIREINFKTNAKIVFRLDHSNIDDVTDEITRISLKIISQTQSDCVLYHADVLIMIHRDNQLILNSHADYWQQEDNLNLVALPYVFEEFSV